MKSLDQKKGWKIFLFPSSNQKRLLQAIVTSKVTGFKNSAHNFKSLHSRTGALLSLIPPQDIIPGKDGICLILKQQ